jgi:hypothetical protein
MLNPCPLVDSNGVLFLSHSVAKVTATAISYPLDVRYTLRACGLKVAPGPSTHFRGFSLGLASVPISVLGSLSAVSFLALIFPLNEVNTDFDFARGVAVGTAGALGGSLLSYPVDTVRRRVITGNFTVREAIAAGRFFRGLPVLIFKAVPEAALLTYSYMCNLRYFSFIVPS